MPGPVDRIFGVHAQALELRARRSELLTSNLANADTPNYKARDLDFKAALSQAREQQAVNMETTRANHMQGSMSGSSVASKYRVPFQSSLDGNTVDAHVEQSKFAENAVRYRASLRFVNGKISSLMSAIKGD